MREYDQLMAYTLIHFYVQIRGSALHCQQQIMIIIITFLFGLAPLSARSVQDLSIYTMSHTPSVSSAYQLTAVLMIDKSAVSRYFMGRKVISLTVNARGQQGHHRATQEEFCHWWYCN